MHAGGTVIDPRLARRFWNFFRSQEGRAPADPYGLTAEEREVLTLVGRGLTNPEVGRAVGAPGARSRSTSSASTASSA